MRTILTITLLLTASQLYGQEPLTVDELKIIGREWFPEVNEDGGDQEYALLLKEFQDYRGVTPNHVRWYCYRWRATVLEEHRVMQKLAGFGLYRVGCLRSVWQHTIGIETFMEFSIKSMKEI